MYKKRKILQWRRSLIEVVANVLDCAVITFNFLWEISLDKDMNPLISPALS